MHEQMKAERTRRAVVTEAEGRRTAAVTTADGERQSAILEAEGHKQRQILQAQGEASAIQAVADAERYRQQTVAQGEADAIRAVYAAIHDGDPDAGLITIKYLEALQVMANGTATKIILPTELAAIAGAITGITEAITVNGTGEPPPPSAD
jgi:regulator of protease activity HflC (stomatin/prohibitin superfamily)